MKYYHILIAIIMIVVVKDNMSWLWGIAGLALFTAALMSAIKIYKIIRTKKNSSLNSFTKHGAAFSFFDCAAGAGQMPCL